MSVGTIAERRRLPVLMLTACNSGLDEVKGLEIGVDDFVRKPFSLAVLQARPGSENPKETGRAEFSLFRRHCREK